MTSCKRLQDKVVLITGGTKGIGYACAERAGLEGAQVVVCSRGKDAVDAAVDGLKKKGIRVHGIVCHVGDAAARKRYYIHEYVLFCGSALLMINSSISHWLLIGWTHYYLLLYCHVMLCYVMCMLCVCYVYVMCMLCVCYVYVMCMLCYCYVIVISIYNIKG